MSGGYAAWDARAYLNEYYARVEPTEKLTLPFLLRALHRLSPVAHALDFGTGPTLHHALALAGHARQVHLADLLPENLAAIDDWRRGRPGAHDWSEFTREILCMETGHAPAREHILQREALLRRRLARLLPCDARSPRPLSASHGRFGLVTSFFCADSCTHSLEEWFRCMRNITGLLEPGGMLVLGALRQCRAWQLGDVRLPSPCIDERHMQFVLDAAGFERSEQHIEIGEVGDQRHHGFESILLVAARGPGAAASCDAAPFRERRASEDRRTALRTLPFAAQ